MGNAICFIVVVSVIHISSSLLLSFDVLSGSLVNWLAMTYVVFPVRERERETEASTEHIIK